MGMARWRRLALRLVPVLPLLAVLGGALPQHNAHAFEDWCYDDPLVYVNGVQQSLTVALPGSAIGHLTGPVVVTLKVPMNHTVTVGPPDAASRFKVQVNIVASHVPATSHTWVLPTLTTVHADRSVAVEVLMVNANGVLSTVKGTSAAPVHATFTPRR